MHSNKVISMFNVLIVAKCIVNLFPPFQNIYFKRVLIVAKCIVNEFHSLNQMYAPMY